MHLSRGSGSAGGHPTLKLTPSAALFFGFGCNRRRPGAVQRDAGRVSPHGEAMNTPSFEIPPAVPNRVDLEFFPDRCPSERCPSRTEVPFTYQCKGQFSRKVDGRIVQRFQCTVCHKGFSSQTFRLDYRIKKPWLPLSLFQEFVSKCSIRQAGRKLGCKPDTVLHHLQLVAEHAREVHALFLARHKRDGPGLEGTFQLD